MAERKMPMFRFSRATALSLLILLAPAFAGAFQHAVPAKSAAFELQTPAPTGRIVVKFAREADVTVGEAGLISSGSGVAARVTALISRIGPGAVIQRRFSRPADVVAAEREAVEARLGRQLPDLNRWAQIAGAAPASDRDALLAVVKALLADPAVETAFLEPVAVPAALGFDSFTGGVPAADQPAPGPISERDTPDYSYLQGYLNDPPEGIGAWTVAGNPGALGASVQVIDIEGAWLWTHEDLPDPIAEIGDQIDSQSWRNHGTAVLGEIRGIDNGYGVRGITPLAGVGASSIGSQSVADAIDNASAALDPGDIILIELHAPGPNANGEGQYGYVCMEFWQDNFDAILLATATGRIVCEAAGNGQQDLDDPVYLGLFDREVRDSGAIMCGATDGSSLIPAWFTNYGSRVDLHGWGYYVTTCGYGNLQGDPLPEEEWYTDSFSGTSSASPIVVGAVAALQGMVESAYGYTLEASLARDILVATGTPQEEPETHIGPRPSLEDAWALADAGIGEVAGTVSDSETGLPIEGVRVWLHETGAFVHTGADGQYSIPALADDYILRFSSFYYFDRLIPITIAAGETTVFDLPLDPEPLHDVSGWVYDEDSDPLPGVRVTPLEMPFDAAISDAEGVFTITGVPVSVTFDLHFDGLPGYGAAWDYYTNVGIPGEDLSIHVPVPFADEDFEADDGGFTTSGDPVWSWGTPAAGGPEGAGFSGLNCWGVGMTGDYGDNEHGFLESPSYDFSGAPWLSLSFHFWRETESGFDGVNLQVWTGGDWEILEPLTLYTDLMLGGLGHQPGWAGSGGGWEGAVFNLSDYIGPDVRFRLEFGSDGGVIGEGFWVDEIAFDDGLTITSAAAGDAPAQSGPRLAVYPNPFNPSTTVAWSITEPGRLEIAVYDPSGRRVRTLLDRAVAETSGAVTWDGRDERGRPAASGIYLVRSRSAGGESARRVVLAK